MKCPICLESKESIVLNSRRLEAYFRRRRQCKGCGDRFTTYEVTIDELSERTIKDLDLRGWRRWKHLRHANERTDMTKEKALELLDTVPVGSYGLSWCANKTLTIGEAWDIVESAVRKGPDILESLMERRVRQVVRN